MPPPGRIHRRRADEPVDRLRDEPAIPGRARPLDLVLAAAAAGLLDEPAVRRGDAGTAEERPRPGRRQEDLGRRAPLVAEQLGDPLDRPADRRDDGEAAVGKPDRELGDVREPPGAEVAEHEHPAVERARDDGGEEARPRDQVEAEVAKPVDRRALRRRSLRAEHPDVVALGRVDDRRQVASGPVQVRLDDLESKPRSDCRVERVSTALEDGHPGGRGEPVRRGDHPERAAQLRTCREGHAGDSSPANRHGIGSNTSLLGRVM